MAEAAAISDTDILAHSAVELAADAQSLQYIAKSITSRLLDGAEIGDLMSQFHALSLGAKCLHREAQRSAKSGKARLQEAV